ncbi:hypothetical protein ACOMHN_053217 [Nucella lapillus]
MSAVRRRFAYPPLGVALDLRNPNTWSNHPAATTVTATTSTTTTTTSSFATVRYFFADAQTELQARKQAILQRQQLWQEQANKQEDEVDPRLVYSVPQKDAIFIKGQQS